MKRKLIFLVLTLSVFLLVKITIFASETEIQNGYELYENRVEEVCKPYKPKKIIYSTEGQDYINIEEGSLVGINYFSEGKDLYKENMNNIYKCMILNSGIKSLKLVKQDLIKNNASLQKEIENKIDDKISELEGDFYELSCLNPSDDNDGIQKLLLLKQTTYELCRYHSYLEYIREYNSDFNNWELDDDDSYNTNYIVEYEAQRRQEIDDEIAHIYQIYPIAFAAYNQYENNLTIHILLELVKEDYIVFREALHKSINPINQVVYKISNAMNID